MATTEIIKTTRYCQECGHIGPLRNGFTNCCTDGPGPVEIPEEVARQAKAGFLYFSSLKALGRGLFPKSRELE